MQEDLAAYISEMQKKGFIPVITINPDGVRELMHSGFGMAIDNPIYSGAIQDCSFLWLKTRIIFRPRNESQLTIIITTCQQRQIPLTFASGKTGLSGAYSNYAVIVDLEALQTLDSPIQIDQKYGRVWVDQSVLVADLISGIPFHTQNKWIFPIQPSSAFKLPVRIGGLIGANASGVMSGKLGAAKEWIEQMRVMLPSGKVQMIEPTDPLFDLIIGGNGRFGVVLSAHFRLFQIDPNMQYHVLFGKNLEAVLQGLQSVQDHKIFPLINEFVLSEKSLQGRFREILGFDSSVHWIILLRGIIDDLNEFERIIDIYEHFNKRIVQKSDFSALLEERTAMATKTMEDASIHPSDSLVLFPGFEDILMRPDQILSVLKELNLLFHTYGLPVVQIGYGHLNFRRGSGLLLHVRLPLPQSWLYSEKPHNKHQIAIILTEVIWLLIDKFHSLPKAEHTLGALLLWYDVKYREFLRKQIQMDNAFYNPHLVIYDMLRKKLNPNPAEQISEPSKALLKETLIFYLNPSSNFC